MNSRIALFFPLAALALIGCVDRGNWKPAPQLKPDTLASTQSLHEAQVDANAWPSDHWGRAYGDPQLDALVEEALAGSPTLAIAQARLRAAQAQSVSARAALAPRTVIDASVTRQRYPQNDLYPPPLGGSWSTEARAALDFSWELD